MKDDQLYLIHMRECGDRIEQYVSDGRETFMHSTLIQDAVLRNLQTLGQSTGRLSDTLRDAHSEVNWRGIVGLRNILVHDYLGISLVRIWEIVEHDLPDLRQKVEVLIQELEACPSDAEREKGEDGT